MADNVRCKRIIGGKTYNTETSTLLAEYETEYGAIEMLFKTRHGAYFIYGEYPSEREEQQVRPLEPADAQSWMEQCCTAERLEAEFGEMPEAGDEEARFTLRIPETLRKRVALIAETNDQSLNAWILRCLERCATSQEKEA
jgi:hypothetical protein